jgi:acetolactate synthase-1/2/3 large subunit
MSERTAITGTSYRAADALVAALERVGARHIFGMPGSHTTTIYDALTRSPSIETILVRNEQAGAFMADGYARVTGEPGFVCTTAGPGATNALTGLGEAWADSIPVVLLAGQVNADRMDIECGAYHEVDLESIFRPVTKESVTVRDPGKVASTLVRVYGAATSGRRRPVALFLPQDLMRADASGGGSELAVASAPPAPLPLPLDLSALENAAEWLASAQRPLILAGGGALWSNAAGPIRTLAQRLGALVITSLNAKGLLDERDPLSLGHARSERAKVALEHADAMLAIGCRFTEVMTDWRRMRVPPCLVQIDLDPAQFGVNYPIVAAVQGDAAEAVEALARRVPSRKIDGWGPILQKAREARPKNPEWLIETLREVVPAEAPVFADACEIGYRMQTDWISYEPRRFFYPSNFITLGWAFPAAVGAGVALRGKAPVVSMSGDGGFLATAQELATAARYQLKVIVVVHNDSTLGAIKNIQRQTHEQRYRDVDLNNPDFVALSASFGVPASRVESPRALRNAVGEALARCGPTLIEVPDRWRQLRDLANRPQPDRPAEGEIEG